MLKKVKEFILKIGIYGLFFGMILVFFSLINGKKVLNFWINDEIDYNEWTIDLGGAEKDRLYIEFFWKVPVCKYEWLYA